MLVAARVGGSRQEGSMIRSARGAPGRHGFRLKGQLENPKSATTLPARLIASGLALSHCAKVYPGAAGLARLHYGGYSKVRGRL